MENKKEIIDEEKRRHNEIFAHDQRANVHKFYDISQNSAIHMKELVLKACDKQKTLLDYGCGKGHYGLQFSKDCKKITGIDISDVGIQMAKQHAMKHEITNVDYQVMDAMNTSFADASFDIVVGNGILHHLDVEKAIAEIYRILKPGGVAVFREPLKSNFFMNLYRFATPKARTKDEHPLTKRDLQVISKQFGIAKYHYWHFLSLCSILFLKTKKFPLILQKLEAMDSRVLKRFPFLCRYSWICIIELHKT